MVKDQIAVLFTQQEYPHQFKAQISVETETALKHYGHITVTVSVYH